MLLFSHLTPFAEHTPCVRGLRELALEGNGVVERSPNQVGESWAQEFGAEAGAAEMERVWAGAQADAAAASGGAGQMWADAFAGAYARKRDPSDFPRPSSLP